MIFKLKIYPSSIPIDAPWKRQASISSSLHFSLTSPFLWLRCTKHTGTCFYFLWWFAVTVLGPTQSFLCPIPSQISTNLCNFPCFLHWRSAPSSFHFHLQTLFPGKFHHSNFSFSFNSTSALVSAFNYSSFI